MSSTRKAAQSTISSSTSSPSSTGTSITQVHQQASASPAAPNPLSNAHFLDSDDDLSDAPETPFLPTFPSPPNIPSNRPPPSSDSDFSSAPETPTFPPSPNHPPTAPPSDSDSDSDLSDAPDSPIWPEGPKTPPRPPPCTVHDCPVRKVVRRHYQGPYLHNGERPQIQGTTFGESNPPPHVWESWRKIQVEDRSSTVEDDWKVLTFLRLHVEAPSTGSGI